MASPPARDDDPWNALRRLTAARIGLKRSGASLATAPLLEFQLAHARARDAVHEALDTAVLQEAIQGLGVAVIGASSAVGIRRDYLMRPDLGRKLSDESAVRLARDGGNYDLAIAICDGLSARAVQRHAAPVLAELLPAMQGQWRIAPMVIVREARVGVGDEIAKLLHADCVAVLIGERPGLSAPDSMGAYLTWRPGAQTTDADRNCISNIRPEGVRYSDAALTLLHLLRAMRTKQISGVRLKDDSGRLLLGER
jgi:ethanolamine ammonia-lyase small subunit